MTPLDQSNYYDLLGIEPSSEAEEIRQAYVDMARIFHPDSRFYDEIIETPLAPEQLKLFREITQAYNVLSDPEKREEYDRTLSEEPQVEPWAEEPENWNESFDISEVFQGHLSEMEKSSTQEKARPSRGMPSGVSALELMRIKQKRNLRLILILSMIVPWFFFGGLLLFLK